VDLRAVVAALEPDGRVVRVTDLGEHAIVAVRRFVDRGDSVEKAQSDLRVEVAERLREAGILRGGE
jgi:small-conductance mechanosensitive channel